MAHLRQAPHALTIPGWAKNGCADIDLSPDRGPGPNVDRTVKVRLTDLDVTAYSHVHYVAHRHECASQTCILAWKLGVDRARRAVGPGPYYSLFWYERDTPAKAILMHSEDILERTVPLDRTAWQVHSLLPKRAAEWRIVQRRYPDAGAPQPVATIPWLNT